MIKKRFLKTKPECKVHFKLTKKEIGSAQSVNLVGEFNDWDKQSHPFKKLKNGDFSLTLNLPKNKTFQFKYLIDGEKWMNDKSADSQAPSPYPGVNNSILST
ncbi:MAG: isoamylase early set domain-containing protein [Candidatus Marinimicrobia bacterium]|nr:isoamylase early set domain-containing protein [Candidatus Neomarinimicrobiota bacterium]